MSNRMKVKKTQYWSQKQAQSGNIHSIIFDFHVGWQSAHYFGENQTPLMRNSITVFTKLYCYHKPFSAIPAMISLLVINAFGVFI